MTSNGILHCRVPPYHLASNGLAENMVKSVKRALGKITKDAMIETHIARFLLTYCNTRHITTSWTPAELLCNQAPRTRLSLVHPCTSQRVEQSFELKEGDYQPRAFVTNDEMLVCDLRLNATDKWYTGTIIRVLGPLNYEVLVDGHTHQAHIDHPLPGPGKVKQPADSTPAIPSPNQPATSLEIVRQYSSATEPTRHLIVVMLALTPLPPQPGISYIMTSQESSPPSIPHGGNSLTA